MIRLFVLRQAALQEADELHLGAHIGRHVEPGQRVVEFRRAVDPDHVVELADLAHDVVALPFGIEQIRRVHDFAQPEDQRRAARLEIGQRLLDLAAQAHRLLVDDEDVGLEGLGRVPDDRLPHLQRLMQVDMALHRRVFAVAQLDDARDLHEVDTRPVVERAGDRRAGDDQHVEAAEILDQRMRDRPAAAQMSEPERVVAVHQDSSVFEPPQHDQNPSSARPTRRWRPAPATQMAGGRRSKNLSLMSRLKLPARGFGPDRESFEFREGDIDSHPLHRRSRGERRKSS